MSLPGQCCVGNRSAALDCSVLEEGIFVLSFVVLEAYTRQDFFSILLLFWLQLESTMRVAVLPPE